MDETKEPALYDLDKTGRDGAETEREVASKRLESHGSENSQAHASKFKLCSKSILDHWLFTTVMTLLTIYALFGDDLRLLATSKADDPIFFSLSIICLFAFTLEIGLGSYVKEGYWLGFFFWLDVIATVSLIPDIGWIWDPIIGNDSDDGNNAG